MSALGCVGVLLVFSTAQATCFLVSSPFFPLTSRRAQTALLALFPDLEQYLGLVLETQEPLDETCRG